MTKETVLVIIIRNYLQFCRSFPSLRSPVPGNSLFRSLPISLLISLCWRSRASSLAVRSSQDLERASAWPDVKPIWFSMPSEQDIRFRLMLRARYADMFSSGEQETNCFYFCLCCDIPVQFFLCVWNNSGRYGNIFGEITKAIPPGIIVWLSCRDVISLWNLCCAEQRFRRYCAILEVSVTKMCFLPLGPPHSMISLRRWNTNTGQGHDYEL